ncbi:MULTISPECIES: hypothetical protein [unclassified Aureispira]|uniref:hypothetical protein n=1 Tax=unclassified Aureispira TaxID=2649989 RepID=UPI0006987051|nr:MULTISPECIES: hypothetical protein [unclassified Aureispira]WMX16913.1 hypothetical protein QP953_11080 [Aureispira sp. CCB-E]
MYNVEQKDYGVKLTFAGFLRETEMKAWQSEMLTLLDELPPSFGMLIDMIEMTAMPAKSQEILMATQKKFKPRISRSATITNSVITDMQSKRICTKTGVINTKIFINASETPDWEEKAIDWIENGVYPSAEGA